MISMVSSLVSGPRTTSTRGSRCAGFHQLATTTLSGRLVDGASWLVMYDDVFARQDGVGRAVPVEIGEDAPLEIEVLEHRLDDESDVVHRALDRCARANASGHGLSGRLVHQSLLLENSECRGNALHRAVQVLVRRVGEDDLVAADREVHGDAVAHEARADDADGV